jgi:Zn-dependent protease/CBS domain-containing protein
MRHRVTIPLGGITLAFSLGWLGVALPLIAVTAVVLAPGGASPDEQLRWYGAAGLVAAGTVLGLIVHDLGHLAAAPRSGSGRATSLPGLVGALPDFVSEPVTPRQDVWYSLAGPATSLVLGGLLGGIWWILPNHDDPLVAAIGVLAAVHAGIGLLNLLPSYPLDGGRVFRDFVWYLTGDPVDATRFAALYGYVNLAMAAAVAVGLLALGQAWSVWGVWILLTVWSLGRATYLGTNHMTWTATSRRLQVNDLFVGSGNRLPAETLIDEAIEALLEMRSEGPALVTREDEAVGYVEIGDVRDIARSQWHERQVGEVSQSLSSLPIVASDAPLDELYRLLPPQSNQLAAIGREGRVIAVISRGQLDRKMREYLSNERLARLRDRP